MLLQAIRYSKFVVPKMGRKITEVLKGIHKFSYSFEVSPGISENEINNITLEPTFYAITWHAKSYEFKDLAIPPMKLADILASKDKNVLLNISCTKMRKDYLQSVLDFLKSKGICNLFVIQGEGYDESDSDFKSTSDLVKSIREHSADYFSIGVAGHCEKEGSIDSLKEKISSGADFIITQAFLDSNVFKSFYTKCKEADVSVPIIPGLFPFENETEVERFVALCKIHVDKTVMETIKNQSSVEVVKNLVNTISTECNVKHFHFFTMNKYERATKVIRELIKE